MRPAAAPWALLLAAACALQLLAAGATSSNADIGLHTEVSSAQTA